VYALGVGVAAWLVLSAGVSLALRDDGEAARQRGARTACWIVLLGIVTVVMLLPTHAVWRRYLPLPAGAAEDPDTTVAAAAGTCDAEADEADDAPGAPPARGLCGGYADLFARADFWIAFAVLLGAVCFAVVVMNNLAPLTASLWPVAPGAAWRTRADDGAYEATVGALVLLFSGGNVAGRVAAARAADRCRPRVARLAWLVPTLALTLLANTALLLAPAVATLFAVVPLAGFGLGCAYALRPLTVTDLFGAGRFAEVWGVLGAAPCLPALVVGTLIAGHYADERAARVGGAFTIRGRRFCLGAPCYAVPLAVSWCVVAAAGGAAVLLWRRNHRAAATCDVDGDGDEVALR
jgi:hypothetical protein